MDTDHDDHMSNDFNQPRTRWEAPATPVVGPSSEIHVARDRLASFFRDRATRAGVLARRLLGMPKKTDEQLADHLVRERRRKTRIDGSVEGSLTRTAWLSWELLSLGCPPDHAAVVRTVGYILAQQERPGSFGEGCSDDQHARKTCSHYVRGFFSPGTRETVAPPVVLPSGVVVGGDDAARFAASCLALRVALRAGEDRRTGVRQHVESLLEMDDLWDAAGSWPATLAFLALGATALGPLEYRGPVADVAAGIVGRQDPDGGWQGVDLLHALDMLMAVGTPASLDAVRRALPLLCTLQHENGAFDEDGSEERALIALRALALVDR